MKLSEKGYLKIGNSIVGWLEDGVAKVTFDPDKIEFEPDDFKDCVALTVEEAKKISTFFDAVEFCAYGFKISYEERILWEIIEKRIEQAEGKK